MNLTGAVEVIVDCSVSSAVDLLQVLPLINEQMREEEEEEKGKERRRGRLVNYAS